MSFLNQSKKDAKVSLLQKGIYILLASATAIIPLFFSSITQSLLITPRQYLLYVVVLIAVFSWVLDAVLKKDVRYRRTVIDIPLLLLFLVFFVSSIFSLASSASFLGKMEVYVMHTTSIAALIFWTILLLQTIWSSRRWMTLVQFLVFVSLAHGVIFLLGDFGIITNNFLQGGENLFSRSNISFACYIVSIMILSLGMLLTKSLPIRSTLLPFLQAVVGLVTVLRIGMSGPLVLLVIGLGILVVIGSTFLLDIRKKVVVSIFTLFIVTLLMIIFGVPSVLQTTLPTEVALSSGASRDIATKSTLANVKQFLVGTGPGTFLQSFSTYRDPALNVNPIAWSARFHQPYNSLYAIASETGVLGIIAFLIVCISVIGSFFTAWFKIKPGVWNAASDEYSVDHSIQLLVFVVAAAFITLSAGLLFQFFDFSMWFVWWTLLALSIVGFSSLVPTIITDHKISLQVSPQYALLMSFGMVIVSTGIILLGIFGGRIFLADVYYTKAIKTNSLENIAVHLDKSIAYRASYPPYMLAQARLSLEEAKLLAADTEPDSQAIATLLAEAVNTAKLATDKDPRNVETWDTLATMYINTQALVPDATKWALQSIETALELDPTNPILHWQLGNLHSATGALESSELSYQEAIRLKPDYVLAYISLAELLETQERYDQAIALYQPIFEAIKTYPEALFNLGRLFYNRGVEDDWDKAKTVLEQAVALSPNYSNVHYTLALIYESEGNTKKALESYETVLRLNPDNTDISKKVQLLTNN